MNQVLIFFILVANETLMPESDVFTKNAGKFLQIYALPTEQSNATRLNEFLIRELHNFIQTCQFYKRPGRISLPMSLTVLRRMLAVQEADQSSSDTDELDGSYHSYGKDDLLPITEAIPMRSTRPPKIPTRTTYRPAPIIAATTTTAPVTTTTEKVELSDAIPVNDLQSWKTGFVRLFSPYFNEFRWHVLLIFTGQRLNGDSFEFSCGGSIVGQGSILTAGSCAYDFDTQTYRSTVTVHYSLRPSISNPRTNASEHCTFQLNWANAIVHPKYLESANPENDLAIIRLPQKIDFTSESDTHRRNETIPLMTYVPVATNNVPLIFSEATQLTMVGYGRHSTTNYVDNKLAYHRVAMATLDRCRSVFKPNICSRNMITAYGLMSQSNPANVELGAPLTNTINPEPKKYNLEFIAEHSELLGILTFGNEYKPGGPKAVGGFVSVPFNYDWLRLYIL